MKRTYLLAAVLGLSMFVASAQDAKPAAGAEKKPGNPLFAALDANGDGELDATEIANAPAALRKLDKNGDGRLTRAEVRGGAAAAKGEKPAKKNKKNK
jgi:hypothetical protein